MGLIVTVYRAPKWEREGFDPSARGITGRFEQLCVVNVSGPFQPREGMPGVLLVDDQPCGKPYPKLIPCTDNGTALRVPGEVGPMFGGNYAATSDSRLCEAVEELCGMRLGILPVHDRFESQEAYDMLTSD